MCAARLASLSLSDMHPIFSLDPHRAPCTAAFILYRPLYTITTPHIHCETIQELSQKIDIFFFFFNLPFIKLNIVDECVPLDYAVEGRRHFKYYK